MVNVPFYQPKSMKYSGAVRYSLKATVSTISQLNPLLQPVLLAVAITAGVYDIRSRRIPNWVALTGLLLGLIGNTAIFHLPGLRAAVLGMGLALLVYFPLYLVRGMGAGDVKLMGAIGAITGPGNWIVIFIITALLGGACALALVLWRGALPRTLGNLAFIVSELVHLRAPFRRRQEIDVR